MLVTLAIVGLFLCIFRLILGSWTKAALAASAFLVLFFSYGHIYNLVQNRLLLGVNVGRHRVLFPLFIIVFVLILVWVWRSKDIRNVTTALNLIGVLVLIYPLYQITSYEIKASVRSPDSPLQQAQVENLNLTRGKNLPDIYYIILDTYTRADTLSEFFSYDNSGFIKNLESMGFYVASCSQSNYSTTDLSLATSLNFNFPQALDDNLTPINKNVSDIYPYLYDNEAANVLRKLGYRFEAVDSGYSPTEFTSADIYYTPESSSLGVILEDGINSYESMLLNSSSGMLLYEFNSYLPQKIRTFLSAYVLHRERILYALNLLDNLASEPGPKFVFVHILAPHNPFVFGPDGESIERKTPFTLNDDRDVVTMQDYIAGYRDQVAYLNQRMLAIVNELIENSTQPPVIIIQGDHGVSRLSEWKNTILNAYYLPGIDTTGLYPTISPVNTFRVIFDGYWGWQLPLLADQSCTTDPNGDPFSCIPITDPNPQCAALSSSQNP